ncbi:hypothetical protein Ddye_027524 [Dipteronia dyeriana]|uniref:Uncharacterized protein n=1 Tax=Dipteronia dyeriana TaxID=168575 RepID=A0AAD9TP84_9ROSI|nr:hypothetical protein Ddye_027524 [Dipteronia dyeriana]
MAFFSNIFSCFAEPHETSKRYVCNGDVCTLTDQKKPGVKGSKNKRKTKQSRVHFPAFRIL